MDLNSKTPLFCFQKLQAIIRVRRMERYFDRLLATPENPDPRLVKLLWTYMDSGLWLRDYTLDEEGMLPKNMKRGVLSEDGLWNLLTELDRN